MIAKIIFSPPGAFIITLFAAAIFFRVCGAFASRKRLDQTDAKKHMPVERILRGILSSRITASFSPLHFSLPFCM